MSADQCQVENGQVATAPVAVPFASEFVTITKQEYVELLSKGNFYKSQHERAMKRSQYNEDRYRRLLRRMKEQAAQREAAVRTELEQAQAKIRDLQQRLFGRHSERHKGSETKAKANVICRPRGHQRGSKNHGRTMLTDLPEVHETIELDNPTCPQCGLSLRSFPGTEDSDVIEIEVKAYRRVIHRKRYTPACQCGCSKGLICAPSAPKLIPKGKFGVSVWTIVLLDKYLYGRPSNRLLHDLTNRGLEMLPGTLADGLHKIAPLFVPIDEALQLKLRSQSHWHADETRWAMFVEVEGKTGHRWYLWVFHTSEVVHYVLDQTRATQVVKDEFEGVKGGIVSCDRYTAYKSFARQFPGFILAWCWAHQRRDFVELATQYPELSPWAWEWIDAIGELYHLNALRLKTLEDSTERVNAQENLEQSVESLANRRDEVLAQPKLAEPCVKVLTSMKAHWDGLTVFVSHPEVPMDNSAAERDIRGPAVGRKNFYGSGALWSGDLAATMYSILATLKLYNINPHTWLTAFLWACAYNGAQTLDDVSDFLPWNMNETRLAAMRGYAPIELTVLSTTTSSATRVPIPTTMPSLEVELIDSS